MGPWCRMRHVIVYFTACIVGQLWLDVVTAQYNAAAAARVSTTRAATVNAYARDIDPASVVWVSSLSGTDSPGCGASKAAPCLTIHAAYIQCALALNCSILIEPAVYSDAGNVNLSMERAPLSGSPVLSIRSWPCAERAAACVNDAKARILCGASDKGWLLSASSVAIQGVSFEGCTVPWLNASLPDMYGFPHSIGVGSAVLILNSSSIEILDANFQTCACGFALTVLAGDPRIPANVRPSPTFSPDFAVTIARSSWVNNTAGAVLSSACTGFNTSVTTPANEEETAGTSPFCAVNASVTVLNCSFAGSVRTMPQDHLEGVYPAALTLLQFPIIVQHLVTVTIYLPSTVPLAVASRDLDWTQIGSRFSDRPCEVCLPSLPHYADANAPVPSAFAMTVRNVSFSCTDAVLCSPSSSMRSRLMQACVIVHTPAADASNATTRWPLLLENMAFDSLFQLLNSLSLETRVPVVMNDVTLFESSGAALAGWSLNITNVQMLHVDYPPQDLGLQGTGIRLGINPDFDSADQFISVNTMNLTSAVTTALLIIQPHRFLPMKVSLINVVCTIQQLLRGPAVQVFASTATLALAQCDLMASQLDVASVEASDSIFRTSWTQPAVAVTVRPFDSQHIFNSCRVLGDVYGPVQGGFTLSCFTSDSARFPVFVAFANSTFEGHKSSAFSCGSSTGSCLCSLQFSDTAFLYNSSPESGGGLRIDACAYPLVLSGNMTFIGNSAQRAGGAMFLGSKCLLNLGYSDHPTVLLLDNNTVHDPAGVGGALCMIQDVISYGNVTITAVRNRARFGAVLASYVPPLPSSIWNCSGNDDRDANDGSHRPNLIFGTNSGRPQNLSAYHFCDGTVPVPPGQAGSDITSYPVTFGVWKRNLGYINVTATPLRAQAGVPIQFTSVLLDAYLQPLLGFQTWYLLVYILDNANYTIRTVSNAATSSYALSQGNATVDNFVVRYNLPSNVVPSAINFTLQMTIDDTSLQPVLPVTVFNLPILTIPVTLEACAPGSFLDAGNGVCVECTSGTYTLLPASKRCFPCPDHAECSVASATADDGYWLYVDAEQGQVSTHLCPQDFCVSGGCGAHRDVTSPLCARCLPGYYDWNGSCVLCESSHVALITLLVFAFMVYVLIQHMLFQRAGAGPVKIFFLFFQTLQLLAQSTANWMPVFVSVLNVQPGNLTSGSTCLYPASWYARLAVQMASPFALVLFLCVTFAVVRIGQWVRRRVCVTPAADQTTAASLTDADAHALSLHSTPTGVDPVLDQPLLSIGVNDDSRHQHVLPVGPPAVGIWSGQALLRSVVAISLLAFQLWVFGVFSFLDCVSVGKYRVMSDTPALDCDSREYHQWAVLYYIMLPVAFVAPVALGILLWKLRRYLNGRAPSRHSDGKRPERLLYILGVCYEGYRPGVFWYELVLLAQRLIFAMTGAVSDLIWPNYPDRRLELLTVELVLACLLQVRVRPFVNRLSNTFATLVLAALAVICHMATYYTWTVTASRHDDGVRTTLVVLVLVPSIALLCLAVLYMLHIAAALYASVPNCLLVIDRWVSQWSRYLQSAGRTYSMSASRRPRALVDPASAISSGDAPAKSDDLNQLQSRSSDHEQWTAEADERRDDWSSFRAEASALDRKQRPT